MQNNSLLMYVLMLVILNNVYECSKTFEGQLLRDTTGDVLYTYRLKISGNFDPAPGEEVMFLPDEPLTKQTFINECLAVTTEKEGKKAVGIESLGTIDVLDELLKKELFDVYNLVKENFNYYYGEKQKFSDHSFCVTRLDLTETNSFSTGVSIKNKPSTQKAYFSSFCDQMSMCPGESIGDIPYLEEEEIKNYFKQKAEELEQKKKQILDEGDISDVKKVEDEMEFFRISGINYEGNMKDLPFKDYEVIIDASENEIRIPVCTNNAFRCTPRNIDGKYTSYFMVPMKKIKEEDRKYKYTLDEITLPVAPRGFDKNGADGKKHLFFMVGRAGIQNSATFDLKNRLSNSFFSENMYPLTGNLIYQFKASKKKLVLI